MLQFIFILVLFVFIFGLDNVFNTMINIIVTFLLVIFLLIVSYEILRFFLLN